MSQQLLQHQPITYLQITIKRFQIMSLALLQVRLRELHLITILMKQPLSKLEPHQLKVRKRSLKTTLKEEPLKTEKMFHLAKDML